jgi:enoyl-CoA hydratase/carnithine racemase
MKLIDLQTKDRIATLTLNRPDKMNAISDDLRSQLIDALEALSREDSVRALVLTGAGKGFCAGGDIAGMKDRMEAPEGERGFNGWKRQLRVHTQVSLLHHMPKPTIAAVNGAATGLGADMALSCDFVIASTAGTFAWSYIKRGLVADGGGMYFLPRRVGLSRAKELIFTGRKVDAEEALTLGIADRIAKPENLLAEAQAWAAELTQGSATALALSKSIIEQTFEQSAEQLFIQGSQAQGICYTSREHREAVLAFLAKLSQKK